SNVSTRLTVPARVAMPGARDGREEPRRIDGLDEVLVEAGALAQERDIPAGGAAQRDRGPRPALEAGHELDAGAVPEIAIADQDVVGRLRAGDRFGQRGRDGDLVLLQPQEPRERGRAVLVVLDQEDAQLRERRMRSGRRHLRLPALRIALLGGEPDLEARPLPDSRAAR